MGWFMGIGIGNKMLNRLLVGLVLCGAAAIAQPPPQPDCVIPLNFTAGGTHNSFVFNNTTVGCVDWTLTYQSIGFSVVSLTFQSAPGSISPGTWVTYAGTLSTGINPNTSTVGAVSTFTNQTVVTSWLRVNAVLTGTGTLNGVAYGYKTGATGGGGGSPSPPSGPAGGVLSGTYPNPGAGPPLITTSTACGGNLTGTFPNCFSLSPTPSYPANQTISGCGVEYVSGLVFTVGACTYTIAGSTFSSAITTETLATADPSNPRIDVIGVDSTGSVFQITGTPAASPAEPSIDPSTQLGLIFVTVAAGATTPSNVAATLLYDENVEWTCSSTTHINCASTNNPYHGSLDIEATAAVLGNNFTLVKPAAGTVNLATQNTLTFYIRSKGVWPNANGNGSNGRRTLSLLWLNGSTQMGTPVVLNDGAFGFSSSNTTSYQQITIPVTLFGTGSSLVTTLKALVSGNGGTSSFGWYIDEVSLQSGAGMFTLPATLMNFKGTWNATASYNVFDTVVSAGIGYVALVANTNVAVSTASTWASVGGTGSVTCAGLPVITGGDIASAGGTCALTINALAVTTAKIAANAVTAAKQSVVTTRRTIIIDNDTQSATALTAAQFSGHAVAPAAGTIVEIDVTGGTQTLTGSATAPTFTGTSSIQIGIHGVSSTTGILSGALATVSGLACALTSTSGTCLLNNGTTSSSSITISTTAFSAGDEFYISAASADTTQTWYTVTIIYTVN
jgi:hypothetical protein